MKRGTNCTEEEIELLIYLYDRGITVGMLAEYFHKNLSTIHRLITKLGLKRKKPNDYVKEFYAEFYASKKNGK